MSKSPIPKGVIYEICDRCMMRGRRTMATKTYTSPPIPADKDDRVKQNLCDACYEYETGRSKLIPLAEKYANDCHGTSCRVEDSGAEHEAWVAAWNLSYHGKMTMLVAEAGL